MAQSEIIISKESSIIAINENANPAASILKSYLERAFATAFATKSPTVNSYSPTIITLEVTDDFSNVNGNAYLIKSDENQITLTAPNEKYLRYAVYTLLESWGFRKFTAKVDYVPNYDHFTYPKNNSIAHSPTFEYRALFYPDAYDEDFRDWHKLDWHITDFGIWGHSFDKLLSANNYFKTNPKFFALYDGTRRPESLCMTNDTVTAIITKEIKKLITDSPDSRFYSVSQNDDAIFCECNECKTLNEKHGGPQGSLYYFLNTIARQFPGTKFTTLAYLHTYNPPIDLQIEPNLYTIFCPIEINRGAAISEATNPNSITKTLRDWNATNSHLYLWDYTVQFSNYMSPFPNIHTFGENLNIFKSNGVKGLFVQGYGDVPGDLYELRQYLLAKLLWNSAIDIETTTDDFLRGFYGNAAIAVKKYLTLLTSNQVKGKQFLDIYSGPLQSRNTFLTPEAMNQYDLLLDEASNAAEGDINILARIVKLRMALEFVYFEQAKFYGKEQHGMFNVNEKGNKEIKKGLTERVRLFSKFCNENGIYELSEGGLSPDEYYEEWVEIAKNTSKHLGEGLVANFITPPAAEYNGKGSYGLIDGLRGHKNYTSNWIGWYGTDPAIEVLTNNLKFCRLKMNFLDDQRHWIFLPQKITVYGMKNQEWIIIDEQTLESLQESNSIKIQSWELTYKNFSMFTKLKIVIQNQHSLPSWRQRKNKKPMVMLDEIELYKK